MLRRVIREQLLRVLSYDTPTWVREHEPTTGLAEAKLAQQYLNAHPGGLPIQPSRGTVCSVSDNSDVVTERGRVEHASSGQGLRSTVEKGIISFYYQQPGHEASVCPARKAKLTGFCYVPREEDIAKDSIGESQTTCGTITVNWTLFAGSFVHWMFSLITEAMFCVKCQLCEHYFCSVCDKL